MIRFSEALSALLASFALTACAGANGEPFEDTAPTDLDEPTVYLDGEDPEQVQIDTEAMLDELRPTAGDPDEVYSLDHEGFHAAHSDNVEKAAITALQGYAIDGVLQFQNGLKQGSETSNDHCSVFGLTCDSAWHMQAKDLNIDTVTDFYGPTGKGGDFKGACGSNAEGTDYYPCIYRMINSGSAGHNFTWRLTDSDCGNATQKAHVRAGIIQGLSRLTTVSNPGTNLTFTEVTGQANYEFACGNRPANGGLLGWWMPLGSFELVYGAPMKDGLPVTVKDTCETTGLPGGTPALRTPRTRTWRPDMAYIYNIAQIIIEDATTFGSLASCATTSAQIRRGIANVVVHEVGHDFGFDHHPLYSDISWGAMKSGFSCNEMISFQYNWHPYMRDAVAVMDMMPTSGETNEVWDNDLSCFEFDGIAQGTVNETAVPSE